MMRSNGYDGCDTPAKEDTRCFPSANVELTCQLADERKELSEKLDRLERAIEMNPRFIGEHHKELWRKQANAMHEYMNILGERIKDLIDLNRSTHA